MHCIVKQYHCPKITEEKLALLSKEKVAHLAAALHKWDIDIDNLVLPDEDANEKVNHGQRGNDGLNDTVHEPNQHNDGVIGHLQCICKTSDVMWSLSEAMQ